MRYLVRLSFLFTVSPRYFYNRHVNSSFHANKVPHLTSKHKNSNEQQIARRPVQQTSTT